MASPCKSPPPNEECVAAKKDAGSAANQHLRSVVADLVTSASNSTNLASFVHTSMDEYGDRLTFENRAINLIGESSRDELA